MDEPSVELLASYQKGDDRAATELFRRYVGRLAVLARARMARKVAGRFDPEDVVLSAYRTFFVRARNGQFSLKRSGDLWRLLVGIVLKKLYHQSARHTAEKRSVLREEPLPEGSDSTWQLSLQDLRSPTAEQAVEMAELVESLMADADPLARQVLEMRLSDYRIVEIASAVQRNERTVRRILDELKTRLARLLQSSGDPLPFAAQPLRHGRGSMDDRLSNDRDVSDETDSEDESADDSKPEAAANDTPAQAEQPGPFLSDRQFVLQAHLGTGGTGRVYRALHKASGRLVALKMLKKASQKDAAAVARFLQEALTVARLVHPGIVAVEGIGRTRAGGYFLIQELVNGQNLVEANAGRQITVPEALRWVAEAALAIEHAHRQGVIHCDLKPANLLLDADGRLRVTDFGLATIVTRGAENRSHIAGTMGYMAPEQLDPVWGNIGPQTDVFGLGAVLFSLLVGHPPFSGNTVEQLLQNMFEASPNLSLLKNRADVSPEVDAVCRKCLALVPADRYASAAELAHSLQAIS
jgi:DNA-directed RNA polymerase specialized sigma24 family protein